MTASLNMLLLSYVRSCYVLIGAVHCLAQVVDIPPNCVVNVEEVTEVIEKEDFKVIVFNHQLSGQTNVKYGQHLKLICDLHLSSPFTVSWRIPSKILQEPRVDGKELDIPAVEYALHGEYITCEVALLSDKTAPKDAIGTNLIIEDLARPKIKMAEKVVVMENENLTLTCKLLAGIPKPTISWKFKGFEDKIFRNLSAEGEELTINRIGLENAGQYRCTAENPKGKKIKFTKVEVQKTPTAIAYKNSPILTYRLNGYPLPRIFWNDGKGRKMYSKFTLDDLHSRKSRDTLVAVTGTDTKVKVTGSDGDEAKTTLMVTKRRSTITKSLDMKTGVTLDMDSKTGSRAILSVTTSRTAVKFQQGFSTFRPTSIKDTTTRHILVTNRAPLVSILEAPVLNVSINKPLQLSCKVNGFPQPDVVWTNRDSGEELKTNISVVELPDDFISILNIDKATNSNYECKASNPLGSDAATIQLQGDSYFRVLRGPTDTTIKYLDRGELHCEVDAYPPATITWYRDKKPLAKYDNIQMSADNTVLTIKEMTPADAGSFFCEARNSNNRKVFLAELSIAGVDGPMINKSVSEINPVMGSDAVISCDLIKGNPSPKITWEYDNNRSEFILLDEFENKTTITLHNVTENEEGTYFCFAENVVSTDYHIVVVSVQITNRAPLVSILGAPVLNVSINKPLQLSCKVNGFPQPDVVWTNLDSGDELKANVSVVELPDDFISILNIDKATNSNYECKASNPLGSDAATIQLQGDSYFRVLRGPTDTTINYLDRGELHCEVDAYPPATITWYRDKKPLAKYDNIQMSADNAVLTIKEMTPADAGSFFCEARNADKWEVFVAELSIAGVDGPMINKSVSKINPVMGADAVISCDLLKGNPTPKITWEYDNNRSEFILLDEFENKTTITLHNVTENEQGTYFCFAENVVSMDYHNVVVSVQYPASITQGAEEVNVSEGETIILKCSVKGWPVPAVTWFKDNVPLRWSSKIYIFRDHSLKIKADESISGTYTCNATNHLGSAIRVVKINLHVPVTISIVKNTKINVQIGDSVDLPCQAAGYPPPNTTWTYFSFDTTVPSRTLMTSPTFSTLSLRSVKLDEDGYYTCTASNAWGQTNITYEIHVLVPVTISIVKNTKINVQIGDSVDLPCQAAGYPPPNTTWTYFSFDTTVPSRTLATSTTFSTLSLGSVELGEDGYYTCTASNAWGQTNITYEIHVLARPVIEKTYTDNTFKSVEGDFELRIPCRASAKPKPVIRWLKDGHYVTAEFTTEDGSLYLKDMSLKDEGTYECEANNSLGTAREIFKVIVSKSPDAGPPTSIVTIAAGNTSAVHCDVPHKTTELVRWYKNNALLYIGELTIRNARTSDSGVYTCRTGDFARPSDGHVMVKVGNKPIFEFNETTDIMFDEGAPYTLNCDAIGEPRPTYTWWHNGELLDNTESFYSWIMELGTQGEYVCEASNEFGNISRTYNVDSRDCIINMKTEQNSELQPLMVSSKLEWIEHPVKNGFMSIPKGNYVVLACPNRFKTLPKSHATAFCEGGSKFKINGQIFDYKDIECTQKVQHTVENTGEKCYHGNTELVEVGFTVLSQFIEAYAVCLDKDKQKPVYATMRMGHSAADVDYSEPRGKWSDDGIDLDFRHAYDCERQINLTSLDLGRAFHKADGCCFGKRQLVSPKDLQIGGAERAAHSKLNVVPHWSTCNVDSNNWNEVEQRVRNLVKSSFTELSVTTGVAGDLTLNASDRTPHRIHVTDRRSQQAVPQYLWKLVQEHSSKSSLVIVQVNIPDLRLSEAPLYVRCQNICDSTKWMNGSNWYDVSKGFTYCCSLKDFEDSFGYENIFKAYYNVLRDVSLLPESVS